MDIKRYITSINNFSKSSDYRFLFMAKYGLLKWMDDEKYLKKLFKATLGYDLDLINPKTFNEKIQWLKLYNRNPIYTTMVDKYSVKEYVANIIGRRYIIPTIGVWDNANQIDFNVLPNQFVLKCTHDSHGLVICKDKNQLNIPEIKKKLKKALNQNYYNKFKEWPYKNVKPRIIAEPYMEDTKLSELRDYKFFCFDGICKFFKVDFDRFSDHHANYFDTNGNLLELGELVCPPNWEKSITLPKKLDKMIEMAEKLSSVSPFLRADFYYVNGNIYFGEMTFYPASGLGEFIDKSWDFKLGTLLKLPENR